MSSGAPGQWHRERRGWRHGGWWRPTPGRWAATFASPQGRERATDKKSCWNNWETRASRAPCWTSQALLYLLVCYCILLPPSFWLNSFTSTGCWIHCHSPSNRITANQQYDHYPTCKKQRLLAIDGHGSSMVHSHRKLHQSQRQLLVGLRPPDLWECHRPARQTCGISASRIPTWSIYINMAWQVFFSDWRNNPKTQMTFISTIRISNSEMSCEANPSDPRSGDGRCPARDPESCGGAPREVQALTPQRFICCPSAFFGFLILIQTGYYEVGFLFCFTIVP